LASSPFTATPWRPRPVAAGAAAARRPARVGPRLRRWEAVLLWLLLAVVLLAPMPLGSNRRCR
jgi:hypothetical protein